MEGSLQSAIVGGLIGFGIVVLFALFSARRKPKFDTPPRRNKLVTSPLPPATVAARIKALGGSGGYGPATEMPEKQLVVLSDGFSLASFGNFYPCFIRPAGGGSEISVGISPRVPQYGPVVSRRLNKMAEAVQRAVEK